MEEILFENPLPLYLLLLVVEALIVAVWLARRSSRWKLAMAIPLLLGAASALTAHLVVTEREYVAAALQEMAAGAQVGDFGPVDRYLADDCRMPLVGRSPLGREAVLAACRAARKRYGVVLVKPTDVVTFSDAGKIVTNARTTVGLATGEMFRLRWRLQWVRTDDGMRIVEVELLEPKDISDRVF